ncbi:MAG: hypothetical protein KDE03_00400 [Rhodobacteraceae bacterium]|nr:hypothetical protein [Paracoccaceae bacterium]
MHQVKSGNRGLSEASGITRAPDRVEAAITTQQRTNRHAGETPQQRRARLRLMAICNDAEAYWDNVPV